MKRTNVAEKIKSILDPKKHAIKARLFVAREDGITVYDTVQNQTTTSVAALVSGVWQASEALMGLVNTSEESNNFRFGFDTSSHGIFLFPFNFEGKRYFLGAIYQDCLNPGQLKRQVSMIKEEMDRMFEENASAQAPKVPESKREGFLFQDITDEEMDRLFSLGGI
ncbi:MAG: hypothetical protein AB7I27_04915 [Bacteriovoracaceae bacterium]